MLRRALRRTIAEGVRWSGAGGWIRRRLNGQRAAILMYHRVLPEAEARRLCVEPAMSLTPETFAMHLDALQSRFHVVPLGQIVDALRDRQPLPPRACAITFDDGWLDNFEYAFPALKQRSLPATVFLVSGRVGTSGAFWPDDVCRHLTPLTPEERRSQVTQLGAESASDPIASALDFLKRLDQDARDAALEKLARRLPQAAARGRELLDWEEVAEMAKHGIDFEAHGRSHAILTGLSETLAYGELESALSELDARGYAKHRLLAYPSGAYNARLCAQSAQVGYRAALTTEHRLVGRGEDLFALPRLGLHEGAAPSEAEFLLTVPGIR